MGKGGRPRTVLLDDDRLVALFRRYLTTTGYRSGPLFRAEKNHSGGSLRCSSAQARWAQYTAAAGMSATLHQLRHTHATAFVRGGVSLATIRKRLGHADLQTVLCYAEQSDHAADTELRPGDGTTPPEPGSRVASRAAGRGDDGSCSSPVSSGAGRPAHRGLQVGGEGSSSPPCYLGIVVFPLDTPCGPILSSRDAQFEPRRVQDAVCETQRSRPWRTAEIVRHVSPSEPRQLLLRITETPARPVGGQECRKGPIPTYAEFVRQSIVSIRVARPSIVRSTPKVQAWSGFQALPWAVPAAVPTRTASG